MSFYSLNRAAINAGVSSFIAGAALLVASSAVEATAYKEVPGGATFSSVSDAQVSGVRNVLGGGSFVSEVGLSAFPALLQLQSATIVATGQLKATYTNSWINPTSELSGSGTVIRPGSGIAESVWTLYADPLVEVGYSSNLIGTSQASADASVQRNGQTTTERDGYAVQHISSGFTADGLRTALVYVLASGSSEYTADGTKIHGGGAYLAGVLSVGAIASTDSAKSYGISDFSALPELTQAGGAVLNFIGSLSADPVLFRPGQANVMAGVAGMSAAGRLALMGASGATLQTFLNASGTRVHLGFASSSGASTSLAQWSVMRTASADLVGQSGFVADGFTNAETPDPESRTMRRAFVDRTMRRPFVDRVMRRQS